MNKVSETAYYCCGVRMLDADSRASLINDHYAHRFMDEHGQKIFSKLKHLKRSIISSIVRARIVDDYLRKLLMDNKDTQLVVLGAGFDSKAFRIAGGLWFEIDEAPIIDKKNDRLPISSCPNALERIAVDFSKNELPLALKRLDNTKKTIFIIEGVFMYLDSSVIDDMVNLLQSQFKSHQLIADLMNAFFIARHLGKFLHEIEQFGCHFNFYEEDPHTFFEDRGYEIKSTTSVIERALEFKQINARKSIINILYPHVIKGYSVNLMEYAS